LILDFEYDQHLESHKHVINIIMGFRDMGCYTVPRGEGRGAPVPDRRQHATTQNWQAWTAQAGVRHGRCEAEEMGADWWAPWIQFRWFKPIQMIQQIQIHSKPFKLYSMQKGPCKTQKI
jgi:hypothetical protein